MALCPDARGPLVDRPDFVEGQIDMLESLIRAFDDDLGGVLHDSDFVDLRQTFDSSFSGNTPVEQFAADMEAAAMDLETKLKSELQQARWKLARLQKVEAAP
jgi:hypothetical protein